MPTLIDVAALRLPRATVKLHTEREVGLRPIDCGTAALLEGVYQPTLDQYFAVLSRLLDGLTREEFDALPTEAIQQIVAAAGAPQIAIVERALGES